MIILVILYNRPDYTNRCLSSLSNCSGIKDCTVYFQIDGFCGEVVSQAWAWQASPYSCVINSHHIGCNGNLLAGLTRAFNACDTVAVLEDDVEVSPDWITFMSNPEFNTPDVTCVCSFRNHKTKPNEIDLVGYEKYKYFCPWGWLTWRDRWEKMKSVWVTNTDNWVSWDTYLNNNFFLSDPGVTITPKIGRSFNFGKFGTFCYSEEEYYKCNYTQYWYQNIISDGLPMP